MAGSVAGTGKKNSSSKGSPSSERRSRTAHALASELGFRGPGADKAAQRFKSAADEYARGREHDAVRTLMPLRGKYPDAAAVRELLGLCYYALGRYGAAEAELDRYCALTGKVDQHPTLMDCVRASRRIRKVEALWEALCDASPGAETVAEGRIVMAGTLADRGRMADAIALLAAAPKTHGRVREHHLRTWYLLADLRERSGDLTGARGLFLRITQHNPAFSDVAARLGDL